MSAPPPNYRRAFWRSRPHLWLALLTLGLGFASGEPLGLLAGVTAYALGLVYLPDSGFFKRSIDARRDAALASENAARLAAFTRQRDQLLAGLSARRRQQHAALAAVCRDIEAATADAGSGELALSLETRLRKLEELLWTYLRLLTIDQSLEVYLETERKEQLPHLVETATLEVETLAAELAQPPASASVETRRKLLQSRRDRLDALQQRLRRVDQSRANLDLARSEQERLVEQVKLIRADAVAHKNAESLGARIDLSIEHLAETNRWLSELSDFKDLTGTAMAASAGEWPAPPPIPAATPARRAQAIDQPPPH